MLTGGTEIQTFSLVNALVRAGHKVVVACYFEHAPVMVERYRGASAEVRLLSPEGTRLGGVWSQVKFLWKGLRQVVKEVRPDVAHVQYMAPGAIPILILKALGVKKIVATAHTSGDIYSKNGLRIIRFLTRYVLHSFQCITENAEKTFFGSSQLFNTEIQLKKRGNHFTIHNSLPNYIQIGTGDELRGT